jgi:hypothetical protein
MPRLSIGIVRGSFLVSALISFAATIALAQFETATVSGQISDPSGLTVSGAQVNLVDIDRGTSVTASTNNSGLYRFASVRPGRYRMEVRATGFRVVNFTGLIVNVQDHLEQNFKLTVGSVSESVTVDGGTSVVDTETGTVSTVVDRQLAENLPMNGRSFQTLIQLTPGVVLTPTTLNDPGQFSINGQRATSNYWMVDGVGANIGVSSNSAAGFAGGLGGSSTQGGTNSLVSVDALQEFRISTSTYAPEFGRTPGGQISIVTRSGTNQFHGTAFDYLRNDVLDASYWFNGYTNNPPLPKAEERQNDFGGTFSGPLLKDRTFFFFSYEGLRLRLPTTTFTDVPDLAARQNPSNPAVQPFLNAYPLPNGPQALDSLGNPIADAAQFNASYSNRSTLDAYSLRIDHRVTDKLIVFGRFNHSPSEFDQRGGENQFSLSTVIPTISKIQTATIGTTWEVSSRIVNDLRLNYSRNRASSSAVLDKFGGAVPFTSLPIPPPFTAKNSVFDFSIFSLKQGDVFMGKGNTNVQRQLNLVDNVSSQIGSHSLKFGVDFRRLTPVTEGIAYDQIPFFFDMSTAEAGTPPVVILISLARAPLLFRNLGAFGQDTWRLFPRFTLTYGLRWDVDFAPETTSGPSFPAALNFNDLSTLALATNGTPAFHTSYSNVAPRVGIAYQLSQSPEWGTVLRGGFGIFFDLATQENGINNAQTSYPFGARALVFGGTFPYDTTATAPAPPITPANLAPPFGVLSAFDPNIKLPHTLQWNMAIDQTVGKQQSMSISYIGAAGRRLIQTALITSPNQNIGTASLVSNAGTSDYHALQVQFQRRLAANLQLLTSYTWAHSIDTASASSVGSAANALVPTQNPNVNRGASDFDIRNAFSAAITYAIPTPKVNAFSNAILRGWSLQSVIQAHSAPPVDISDTHFFFLQGAYAEVRPDVVPGFPFYLHGAQYPGGTALNPAAFTDPPTTPGGCIPGVNFPCDPARQGTLGRNALRGFGATQWDFAVHRDFPVSESVKLQFRAEMFNILNHPNFGPPNGGFGSPSFGLSSAMLGQSLAGTTFGAGGLSPLYQIGGPRSMQFALKLSF